MMGEDGVERWEADEDDAGNQDVGAVVQGRRSVEGEGIRHQAVVVAVGVRDLRRE